MKRLIILFVISQVECAKILAVFPTPSISHQFFYQPIWKELSLRGHQVVVLTPNPLNDPSLTNLTEIDLKTSYDFWKNEMSFVNGKERSVLEDVLTFVDIYSGLAEIHFQNPKVQRLIKNRKERFDLLIVEWIWPTYYAFKDRFNCSMIGITSIGLTLAGHDSVGNPSHPLIRADFNLPFSKNPNFIERLYSIFYAIWFRVIGLGYILPNLNRDARKYFGGETRSVRTIASEVDLLITNSNPVLQTVRPNVPAIIEISGLHIRRNALLPTDLQMFLDEASEGAIYFSLGTNVRTDKLHRNKMKIFLETFSELPYSILWKSEYAYADLPKNVKIRKWFPQQEVLQHPNIKLFITQGGIQSVEETLYNKVPIIGIPFMSDQYANVERMVEAGVGLSIKFEELEKNTLKNAISEVIKNSKYKKRAEELQEILSDQPVSGLEKAMWWVEYVIRHKGARHLRSPALDLPLYQYFLLDVVAFLALVAVTLVYIAIKIFKTLRKTCKRKISSSKKHQ